MRPDAQRQTSALDSATLDAHVVQFYEDDVFLVEQLARFVEEGFARGDAVLVAATQAHLGQLEERLGTRGIDLAAARDDGRLVSFQAEETLDRLIVDGVPDAARFAEVIADPLRATVEREGGTLVARLTGPQGSGLLTSMARADALLVLSPDRPAVAAGETVDALMLRGDDWSTDPLSTPRTDTQ